LDDVIVRVWEELAEDRAADCPVCGGDMQPVYGAGAQPVGGRCNRCHTILS
jgi:tRNA(Ile2) C34 agmatinyltransferase TiaS